ncbi:ABC transporter permease [Acidicapsa ligni]|uniref:ABC transporter permease n=1 Tax=Acidicapsa ligni TaxID=542300 RepID=UPI0021E06298|nr:ABC transporter permease [Acidicapsa ligni]
MPEGLHNFLLRLTSLFRKYRLDREMAEELEFHQAMLRDKMLSQGISPSEADATMRQTFGNPGRWHERLRELWQFRTLENFLRDVSFSARLLRKSLGFTIIAVLTLALGVGANTTIFSLINGLLLRPLPVPHSEQMMVLSTHQRDDKSRAKYSFNAPYLRSLELRQRSGQLPFTDVFGYFGTLFQVKGNSGNEVVRSVMVSGQYFNAMQVPPLMGRYLTPQDDTAGGNPAGLAVVISERFWQRWFNRAPDAVGRKLLISNQVFTVVGVMPKRFTGADPTQSPDLFTPLAAEPILDAPYSMIDSAYHAWWLNIMARAKPGTSIEQANAAVAALSSSIIHDSGDADFVTNAIKDQVRFSAESGSRGFSYFRSMFQKPLEIVFVMCGGILLLACINLTSLLMARSAARERELATRLAMGATRRRLVQQLLIESLMIAMIGTGVGLAAAPFLSRMLAAMLLSGAGQRAQLDTSLDVRVLFFAAIIAVTTAVLIGLVPALRSTSGSLSDHIKDGQYARQSHQRRAILPRILMASEVCLALILVAGAGLLATSVIRLYKVGTGFDPHGVVNIALSMDKQPLDGEALTRLYQQIAEGLSRQPGVKSVGFVDILPLSGASETDDYPDIAGTEHIVFGSRIGADYFHAMRIPILAGRDFTWSDTIASGSKIILNESAARALFPDRSYRSVPGENMPGSQKKPVEIIGIVGDTKYNDLRSPAPASAYSPMTQSPIHKGSYTAVIRIEGPAAPFAAATRDLTMRLAPDIPVPVMTTMSSVVDDSITAERMMAILAVYFAACALLVTGIGLYGTLSYATARRTSEIGIRMALGAKRVQVVTLVFRENAAVALVGSVAGLAAAFFASRVLASFLYGTSARDPWVLGGSVLALVAIACVASLLPALRAARIDPMAAIRCE